jgi:hypothetical protein
LRRGWNNPRVVPTRGRRGRSGRRHRRSRAAKSPSNGARLTTAGRQYSLLAFKQYRFVRRFSRAVAIIDFGAGETGMFGISDLFQWERFVTPTVIKVFYWLAVVISVLLGLACAVSSLATMAYNPFVGMIFLIASLLGACMGVIVSRIVAEFVLIVFRINEHLGAIRNQGQQM